MNKKVKHPFLSRSLDPEMTQEEIAAALGMSRARVSQIERSGLERLERCKRMIDRGFPIDVAVQSCKGNTRPWHSGLKKT